MPRQQPIDGWRLLMLNRCDDGRDRQDRIARPDQPQGGHAPHAQAAVAVALSFPTVEGHHEIGAEVSDRFHDRAVDIDRIEAGNVVDEDIELIHDLPHGEPWWAASSWLHLQRHLYARPCRPRCATIS